MAFKLNQVSDTNSNKSTAKESTISDLLQKDIISFSKTFSNKKKEDFYTELSVLLKAGITLKEGLQLLGDNEKKDKLKNGIIAMADDLVSGHSFSDTIFQNNDFTEYEYQSIKIGEETGALVEITKELGKFYQRKNEQRRNLINALTYPVIILTTAVLVVIFMLQMVVPMFEDIFRQNNVELPPITKFIVSASNFMETYWLVFVGILISVIVFRRAFVKKEWFKKYRDRFLLKLPFIGKFIKLVYLAQFTQAVSLLTNAKVPITQSINLVKKMIDFYPLKKALSSVEGDILKGSTLSESLQKSALFDPKMISLVKVSEETNQTGFIFERLNEQYNIELQQKSKLLSTVIEPFIILIVGILVGVILIAMYLPMFKISSVLG